MKKLIALSSILFLISCSKELQQPNDSIIGTWKITYVIVDGQIFKDYTDLSVIPCVGNSTWEFKDNFDYNTVSYSSDSNESCVTISEQGQWAKNGDQYEINSILKRVVFPDKNTMYWIYDPDPDKDTYWEFQRTN